jgi:hypothetical protein
MWGSRANEVDLRANWVFRVTAPPEGLACLSAVRRTLVAASVFPVLAAWAAADEQSSAMARAPNAGPDSSTSNTAIAIFRPSRLNVKDGLGKTADRGQNASQPDRHGPLEGGE